VPHFTKVNHGLCNDLESSDWSSTATEGEECAVKGAQAGYWWVSFNTASRICEGKSNRAISKICDESENWTEAENFEIWRTEFPEEYHYGAD
jgi:hypothetical protein